MAVYVFEPELLTHAEVCDSLIALLGPVTVSVANTVRIAYLKC